MGKEAKKRGANIRERHFDDKKVTRKEYQFTFKQRLKLLFGAHLIVYAPALLHGRLIPIEIQLEKPKKQKRKK